MKIFNSATLFCGLALLLSNIPSTHAQVCATPAKNGTNNSLTGTLNSYWTPTNGTYNGLSSAIGIGSRTGAAVNIAPGDLVLVIQIQCANINSTDTDAYGDGIAADTSFGSPIASGYTDPAGSCLVGQYEYLRAGPASNATSLDLSENPLNHTYVQAAITTTTGRRTFQVIRVPQYDSATLTGTVTAPVWNGSTGGIVALDIANQLNFAGNSINVDGAGFRGAGGRARSINDAVTRYRTIADTVHAGKGEGIVSTPRYVSDNRSPTSAATTAIVDLVGTGMGYPSGTANPADFARGAPGNAGGGGTFWNGSSDNGGGGAGGNGGAGGRGGAGWRSAGYAGINVNYSNLAEKKWGFGGSAFNGSIARLVFGGGGGAGDNNNNSTPQESSGAAGGGMVLIRAREILGTGTVTARGARASNNSLNDGAGAGGAGGSIVVIASDMSTATLSLNAAGGRGGDTWLTGGSAHGTGGGGGGGVVYRSGAATVDVTGGANGLTNTSDSPSDGANHGAKPGGAGINQLISVPTDIPGINTGFRCLDYGDAPASYGLANHNLNRVPDNLRLGALLPDGDATILSGIPSANADFDDLNGNADEDGVTLPSTSTLSGIYTAAVVVHNNTGSNANLCGWIDFDQDGVFQTDESVCQVIASMAANQNINMAFTVPVADRTNTGQLFARFRLTTNSLTTANPTGQVDDGEVEDYTVMVTTLPVSVYQFNSRLQDDASEVDWATASETNNLGFNIWGVNAQGSVKLNQQPIASKNTGVLKSTQYNTTVVLHGQQFEQLALSAVDIRGREELFGYFQVGEKVGRTQVIDNIDWNSINQKNADYLLQNLSKQNKTAAAPSFANNSKILFQANASGMQSINHADLLAQGMDLTGVKLDDIAVSIGAQPLARFIGDDNQYSDVIFKNAYEIETEHVFGENTKIQFWAKAAEFPDAEYLDFYTYSISVNPQLVKQSVYRALNGDDYNSSYVRNLTDDTNNEYGFIVPSADPWFAKRLVNFASDAAKEYTVNFEIDAEFNPVSKQALTVRVSGGTDMPQNPDHELSVFVNEQWINTTQFEGVSEKIIHTAIPANVLQTGNNTVRLRLTEGTAAQYDIVNVDTITLSYGRNLVPIDNVLQIDAINNTQPLQLRDFIDANQQSYALYAYDGENLTILQAHNNDDGTITVANNQSSASSYWISADSKLHKPIFKGVVQQQQLIDQNVDFLIIAHPAFMPVVNDETHALNQYMQARSAQGWNIKLVSITDIQNQFGGGMALPAAITDYLRAYQAVATIEHVLLIGSDSYDYKNYLGLNSSSFIPTIYAATTYIPHTPSDALLTDIDNDGMPNLSIGRWPVRNIAELNAIIHKTLNWSNASDLNAVFITDIEETESLSFTAQAERIIDNINNTSNNGVDISRIYPNNIELLNGENRVDKAKEMLFSAWENSYTLTNFIGHGSATQWSRQGLLVSGDLNELNNANTPTLIGTMTCYSSYFVSPDSNSLSLNLINGVNSMENGAVVVHGAATLSNYSGNEIFAQHVIQQQLQGKTLGQAILSARLLAQSLGYHDQVMNWTLLGDPSLRLNIEP